MHGSPVTASRMIATLLLSLFFLTSSGISSQIQGTLHFRNYFYVGEQYVAAPGTNNGTEIAFGQVYVEHLVPANVTQTLPILMIHGDGEYLLQLSAYILNDT